MVIQIFYKRTQLVQNCINDWLTSAQKSRLCSRCILDSLSSNAKLRELIFLITCCRLYILPMFYVVLEIIDKKFPIFNVCLKVLLSCRIMIIFCVLLGIF